MESAAKSSSLINRSADESAELVNRTVNAMDLLRPIGILLFQAIDSCVASRLQSGNQLVIPPRRDDGRGGAAGGDKNVAEIVGQLLLAKKDDGVSVRYLETIRSHLVRFADAFEANIASITAPEIENWLRIQKIGPRARNNIRASIITVFHFARKHGYLPKGQPTEADEVAKAKDRGGKIGILKPQEFARVLGQAPEKSRLFLALGAFTGMRSSEILRLDWSDINFERSFITVSAEKAKTATRRLVPIQPNLIRWLTPYRGRVGLLFSTRRDAGRAIAFAKSCEVEWPNNALRHSYATYRLAATANAARVALEMGNSPQKLMTNYRELADEKEAETWFAISPDQPTNVIQSPPKFGPV